MKYGTLLTRAELKEVTNGIIYGIHLDFRLDDSLFDTVWDADLLLEGLEKQLMEKVSLKDEGYGGYKYKISQKFADVLRTRDFRSYPVVDENEKTLYFEIDLDMTEYAKTNMVNEEFRNRFSKFAEKIDNLIEELYPWLAYEFAEEYEWRF